VNRLVMALLLFALAAMAVARYCSLVPAAAAAPPPRPPPPRHHRMMAAKRTREPPEPRDTLGRPPLDTRGCARMTTIFGRGPKWACQVTRPPRRAFVSRIPHRRAAEAGPGCSGSVDFAGIKSRAGETVVPVMS